MTTGSPPRGEFRPAKDHPGFPPEIAQLLRFYVRARGEKLPPCPACGRRPAGRWTMLCPFRAYGLDSFALEDLGPQPALALVCRDHPINPTPEILAALGLARAEPGAPGPGA
jgi:hypothetical protein